MSFARCRGSFSGLLNWGVRFAAGVLVFVLLSGTSSAEQATTNSVLIIVGAAGDVEYATNFTQQAALWSAAAETGGNQPVTIGLDANATNDLIGSGGGVSPPLHANATNDLMLLRRALEAEPVNGPAQLWLVFIGHGTFDNKQARFNLRGPDLTAGDLADWLKRFHRPLAIINTSSSSAPFLNALSGTNRLIITATRSGHEQNYTRFGRYLAEVINDPGAADLDKDNQVSLLEAFLVASRRTGEFYKVEGRIATEHALMDDNGDGLGTPADWFRGVRAIKKPTDKATVDGLFSQQFNLVPNAVDEKLSAAQKAARDAIEQKVFALRETKDKLPETDYYTQLESALLELAKFYEALKH